MNQRWPVSQAFYPFAGQQNLLAQNGMQRCSKCHDGLWIRRRGLRIRTTKKIGESMDPGWKALNSQSPLSRRRLWLPLANQGFVRRAGVARCIQLYRIHTQNLSNRIKDEQSSHVSKDNVITFPEKSGDPRRTNESIEEYGDTTILAQVRNGFNTYERRYLRVPLSFSRWTNHFQSSPHTRLSSNRWYERFLWDPS